MADTGNPWFIPFAEPSDLVRDWPALSSAVGTAVAAGLSAANNAGIGSNVVQTVKTNVFTASVAQGADSGDVTGLTVAITPSSATSKVLVLAQINLGASLVNVIDAALFRDGALTAFVGDADGSRRQVSGGALTSTSNRAAVTMSLVYLDSPATDIAVTYSLRLSHTDSSTTTLIVNRGGEDSNASRNSRSASSITAIEVKV
jgi:hypothetical protein